MTTTTTNFGRLQNARTGTALRAASEAEEAASIEAAKTDGGHGLIEVEIDDETVVCFVS